MKFPDEYEITNIFWLIYLFKSFHDEGKSEFIQINFDCELCTDFYYDFFLEALESAAEIVTNDEAIYKRHGYVEYDDEVNIWSFSCKEMKESFKLAYKLHRLEENPDAPNPYFEKIYDKAERERNFYSYSFDYFFVKKRKAACLDILWGYDFSYDVLMVVWVLKVMRIFKYELPALQAKYCRVRREKRSSRRKKTGGIKHAA